MKITPKYLNLTKDEPMSPFSRETTTMMSKKANGARKSRLLRASSLPKTITAIRRIDNISNMVTDFLCLHFLVNKQIHPICQYA